MDRGTAVEEPNARTKLPCAIGYALMTVEPSVSHLKENSLALAAAEEARAIFERVGARPYLEHLEAAIGRPAVIGRVTRPDAVTERSGSPS